ncbi:hypothetical protein niasHT_034258 [Heterodera trifolii]|uniref:Uncharacterized protein n=1 Tax=Heterodera trifolii TaxID=157864 RepID=A0ABD2IW93_9BILA
MSFKCAAVFSLLFVLMVNENWASTDSEKKCEQKCTKGRVKRGHSNDSTFEGISPPEHLNPNCKDECLKELKCEQKCTKGRVKRGHSNDSTFEGISPPEHLNPNCKDECLKELKCEQKCTKGRVKRGHSNDSTFEGISPPEHLNPNCKDECLKELKCEQKCTKGRVKRGHSNDSTFEGISPPEHLNPNCKDECLKELKCHDKCNKKSGTSKAKSAYCYEDCMGITFLELLNTSVRCREIAEDVCPCGWAVCIRRKGYPRDLCCPKDYDVKCCSKKPYADRLFANLLNAKFHKALNDTSDAVGMCFPIIGMITLALMAIILPA